MPDTHVVLFPHTFPQPPQAFTLLVVAVSHPFATLLSQLPKPAAHWMEQAPFEHDAAPFCELHALPHPPQLATLTAVLISQPFCFMPSQSANVPLHETSSQVPVAHDAVIDASHPDVNLDGWSVLDGPKAHATRVPSQLTDTRGW